MPREHGGIVVDGKQVGSTLQCPHCGGHFVSIVGSGIRRTYCVRCQAVTCGKPCCDACIPLEAKLEYVEGSKNHYTDTINDLIKEGGILL
jgi:hypothetical protein